MVGALCGGEREEMIEIHNNGQVYLITTERVEQIIRWLVTNERRMMLPDRMQVTFHCAGERVMRVEVKELEKLDNSAGL